jgi:diguanylate cyclase (GGDEF)-like protein
MMTPEANTTMAHRSLFDSLRERLAHRPDSEHGQAFIRIIIGGIGLLYILILNAKGLLTADQHHMLYLVYSMFITTVAIFALIVIWPQTSPLRRHLAMVFDFCFTSYFMYVMEGSGILFFPVYLWVTIGNGLRYGKRYLYTAMAISIASFSAVFVSSAYWRAQWGFSIGLLIGLIALPLYFSRLLKRLNEQHSELKKLYEQMARHAIHDSLTGLPNRKHFHDKLAETIVSSERGRKTFALLYLDLDGFKAINDDLGHAIGDQIIEDTARRLEQCVRKDDMVARMGGDEFVVLLRDVTPLDLTKVAEKIIETLSRPFTISNHVLRITTSVGGSTYPQDGVDANTLIHNADSAMYETKRNGKNGYRIFSNRLVRLAQ